MSSGIIGTRSNRLRVSTLAASSMTLKKLRTYHETARELAAAAKDREPKFTDKEKINLEIFAERQNDEAARERYLDMARGESHSQDREVSASLSR